MSRERETLLDNIELSLYTLTEDNLRYLCERIGIGGKDGSEVKGKTQRSLRRIVGEYCENVNQMESDEQGTSRLLQLKKDIKGIQEDARGVPTSPSQSATAEVDTSQASCDGEPNEEGGSRLPHNRKLADPAPEWLIIPEQRESLDPDCDSGTRSVQQEATVLLEDCRFMLGRRFNIKAEEQEQMISVFANEGEGPESSDSSVETLSTPGEKHPEVDEAKRSHHSPQRTERSTKRSQPKRHLHTHSGETSSPCSVTPILAFTTWSFTLCTQ
ncbi:uncharacterized protein LOC129813214 isoform X2 [Salvelinus fontinalis]|uniref:uncharacterized protein LOC129813214 isoform X2 n=1 Tax=Salvelinus fontinalis TaxID=8038 RepID=UPI002485AE42|nr:uncharacterized protein LOC129813214 isoform X2 [Salvelinus fontinalis]